MSSAGPASLFKLIESRYGEALVQAGEIKISTLYTCRRLEDAGIARSHARENTKEMLMNPDRIIVTSDNYDELDPLLKRHVARPAVGPVIYDRYTFREVFDGADLFVYCTSHFRTRRMERRFSSGKDVWLEIFDPPAFFSELTKGISDVASFAKEGPVAYRPSSFAPHAGAGEVNAALFKSLEFEAEAEWRVLWEPRTQPIDPLIRTLPELTKYCRISAHPLARASR